MSGWGAEGADAWVSGGGGGGGGGGGDDTWGGGGANTTAAAGGEGSWGAGDDSGGGGGGDAGDKTCRVCNQVGHFARDCPDKPEGGGLTGECYNCGEVGHNKADCTNPKVERPFTGTCNLCGVEGHSARNCPTSTCRLCGETGHKALECKSRRLVDWKGVPELDADEAWLKLTDSAKGKDLDAFRLCLRSYARAINDDFNVSEVETTLRVADLPVHLIAIKQEVAPNMTIVDLIGNPDREFVLTLQFSAKPRRGKLAQGWPADKDENLERLKSSGFVQDRGVPMCSNCNELGHIKKHCKQEVVEHEKTGPTITCVYCHDPHRARDCPKDRINPYACKNCKKDGHIAKECPEPRSAEGVECRKCNETGHFSRDCPKDAGRAPRTCRNCGSEDHIAKECDQPRNPDMVTCRNCEKQGHFSRDCPEPKDWSKVKCSNCGEMGHTIKRCKVPIAEGDGAVGGDSWGAGGDAGAGAGATASGDGGAWKDDAPAAAAGGEDAWARGGW